MTDIEQRALALVNAVETERGYPVTVKYARKEFSTIEALCRALEQHEAFRQEVSDAVEADVAKQIAHGVEPKFRTNSVRFIITKPDPLVEAMAEVTDANDANAADQLRTALAARGLKIVEVGHD